MLVSEILRTLPTSLEWMVLFNLSAIRELADSATIRAMYHLGEEIDLKPYSHWIVYLLLLALLTSLKVKQPL